MLSTGLADRSFYIDGYCVRPFDHGPAGEQPDLIPGHQRRLHSERVLPGPGNGSRRAVSGEAPAAESLREQLDAVAMPAGHRAADGGVGELAGPIADHDVS